MSLLTTLHTGQTGLKVASAGLATVGHNVTNASTEGYSRRGVSSVVADPINIGGLSYGQGASVLGFQRASDRFLDESFVDAWGEQARSSAALQTLQSVEAQLDETGSADIASTYEAFFDELSSLAADPSDPSRRLSAITAAVTLTDSVGRLDSALSSAKDGVTDQLDGALDGIQEQLDSVAALNAQVVEAGGTLGGGDYADQLYRLTTELAESLGVKADFNSDGQATLFVGGHAIVSGTSARQVALSEDADGAPKLTVSADGGTINITDDVGGTFGGLLDAWSTLDGVDDSLDEFVSGLAEAFNTQHAAGYDANGTAGGDFFEYDSSDPSATFAVSTSIQEDTDLFAAAGASTAYVGDGDNLSQLIDLQDQELFADSSQTGSAFLSSIYSSVGGEISRLEIVSSTHESVVADLSELRASVSGVDLDEEATDLLAWQAAYQAAARVVSVANDMLGELLSLAG